jgi:hypothetical protein
MMDLGPAYGHWILVMINALIILGFAFSFFQPRSRRDWRAFGAFSAFIVALFTEMHDFPYLATVLPAIGLPFLSGAVAGLAWYQTIFFIIGVISNILGIAYMLRLGVKSGLVRLSAAY